MSIFKKVSVITVNFNGKKHLPEFLESISKLEYPKKFIETIVVDNGSTDDSVSYIKKNYPEIRVITNGKNLGFAKANNIGIKKSTGEFILLLNNDTVVDSALITEMLSCFENDNKVAAVNAKLVLFDRYIRVSINGAHFSTYLLTGSLNPVNLKAIVYASTFDNNIYEEILIPYGHLTHNKVLLDIELIKATSQDCFITVGKTTTKIKTKGIGTAIRHKVSISVNDLQSEGKNLTQNTGNYFFRDGYGRDRGSIVINHELFHEIDEGQYDNLTDIEGFCGAGAMLRKEYLEKVGLFDEKFFFYYEDADLSFRLRKYGCKILFCPKAIIRHVHAATSKSGSDFFLTNAETGRLIFLLKHWPIWYSTWKWLSYIITDSVLTPLYYLSKGRYIEGLERFVLRTQVNLKVGLLYLSSILYLPKLTWSEVEKLQ